MTTETAPIESQAEPEAARVERMIREALEKNEVATVDDPGPHHPEFQFEPEYYQPLGLLRQARPFSPTGQDRDLGPDVLHLIRELRGQMQKHRIAAGHCKAYIPTAEDAYSVLVYLKIGAFVFTLTASPIDSLGNWRLGLFINVDPDSVDD